MPGSGARVVVVAPEPIGPSASGPARRACKLAEVVGEHCRVTLAAPSPSTFPPGPYAAVESGPVDDQRIGPLLRDHDIAIVQMLPSPRRLLSALRHTRRLVVDVLAPLAFEAAEIPGRERAVAAWRMRELATHVAAADIVLTTNARQRDFVLGLAAATSGSVPDPARVVVVPHGIDEAPPRPSSRPLRAAGLVGADDRVAAWAGGMWSWLDPLTPIKAVEHLHARRPDIRLALVGTSSDRHPRRTLEAAAYVRERGLEGNAVVTVPGPLERASYLDHLTEADVGVSAHGETLEAHFATRTRVLDFLWAGVPVVCSAGDAMAEFVAAHGLGAAVAPGDVGGFADALERVLDGDVRVERDALAGFRWRQAAEPLVEYCRNGRPRRSGSRARLAKRIVSGYPSFALAVREEAAARRAGRRAG